MDQKVIDAAAKAYPAGQARVTLGAVVHDGACNPQPTVGIPLAMLNRHGLIAGATGTGKTKTLQLVAEQLSASGVPVFLADVKGDLAGIATAGSTSDRVTARASETGYAWTAQGFPVEFLSLTGERGAQLRATVSSFGPLLLGKVLGLNETQTSVLTLVFKWADDKGYELYDFPDLRAVLQFLTSAEGAAELKDYGGMSKQTVGVLLREMVELEQQGAEEFFGEPEFDLDDLLHVTREGRGRVSVLELTDMQDKPALFSTFMLWMLARLYATLPEAGDLDKPKLVFFLDEAHLLFDGASKAFKDQVEQVVRLIRSKGVGVFFITQSPRDIPADILGQLGNRVQHALRAFTPDDQKALNSAAKTFPKTPFYDVADTLTTMGIGEALVTVLSPTGAPTPPFHVRLVPPASRMGPLTESEFNQALERGELVRKYQEDLDRESAREKLEARTAERAAAEATEDEAPPARSRGTSSRAATSRAPAERAPRAPRPEPSALEQIASSSVVRSMARTATTTLVRGLLGALIGPPRRRR